MSDKKNKTQLNINRENLVGQTPKKMTQEEAANAYHNAIMDAHINTVALLNEVAEATSAMSILMEDLTSFVKIIGKNANLISDAEIEEVEKEEEDPTP